MSVEVIIETPSGSRTKYSWLPVRRVFQASKVLPLGLAFPYDFGFVPDTRSGDGDPLDALVIADAPLAVGCLVEVRVLGAIAIRTGKAGERTLARNDRLIAVPTFALRGAEWQRLDDIGDKLVGEIEEFFRSYTEREGRKFELHGRLGRDEALQLVERSRT